MDKGKGFMQEFQKFISRGNVIDMAVGMIVGSAFTAIISSLVDDVISPFLGIFGGMNFDQLVFNIGGAAIGYGKFITAVINFVIMAFVVFCLVKFINGLRDKITKKEEEAPAAPTTKKCPYCLSEIPIEATRCAHCTSRLEEQEASA